MGKKQKKPGKGKEKTERKTAKAAEKRERRESKKPLGEEDDIDAILAKIQKEEARKVEVHIEENVPAPSPRCNCSVTVNPLKDTELILYGGEFYNGDKTYVYNDLYRYNTEKHEWKLVSSPNTPPPRSAHQAVAWKNSLFMFGGEFTSPNQEKFHHYKDLWRFDLNTNSWEQLQLKGCPSPRSGHRMVLYKHKIILFGGFYDTLREVRYLNDLHVLDLDEYKWQEIKPKLGAAWPSPRSAFQLAVHLDEIFLYGGYFKEHVAEKDGSEKGIVHADMWVLNPCTWEWNKVKKQGIPPNPRAGFSMYTHKKRAILFGGVVDTEEGDVLQSTFLNELYAFQMDNYRWYPLELRKAKASKSRSKLQSATGSMVMEQKKASQKHEPGFHNTTGCHDNEEDMDIERTSDCDMLMEQIAGTSLASDRMDETSNTNGSKKLLIGEGSLSTSLAQVVRPCGRINASMVVAKDTLFLYGGLMEMGETEVTLDDLYCLDLNKLDEWKCLIEASKTEWVEPSEEGDETEDDSGTESESVEEENDEIHEIADDRLRCLKSAAEEAAAVIRGEGKKLMRKERKAKIEKLRSELGLADSQRTPKPGESLKEFFSRTSIYWQMAAYEHTQHTGKELRKDGFDLAEARYKELKPVLDEIAKLEAEQKAEEEQTAPTLVAKKAKEKARHSFSQR